MSRSALSESELSGCEMSESNMSGSQTSRSEISGSECPCAKCLDPKRPGAICPGPKCPRLRCPAPVMSWSEKSARVIKEVCCALAIEYKCKTSNINKHLQNSNGHIEYK